MKEDYLSHVSDTPAEKDVELLSLLKRLEIFDEQTDAVKSYSLKTEAGSEFVRSVLTRSLSNCYENIRRVEASDDEMPRLIARIQKQLCPKTGGVVLSLDEVRHPFFLREGCATDYYGYWASRGPLYYIFSDTFMGREECIEKMLEEYMLLKQNIGMLSDTAATQAQKTAYLDYLKNFFLIVYHAFTYPERFGVSLNEESRILKSVLRKACEEFTRMYYQALLGSSVDYTSTRDEFECVELRWDILVAHFKDSKDFESGWFKYSELDDPVVILKAAYSFLKEDADVDIIIGIESGGTELCFVTKLLYRLLGNSGFVRTELVALSRYTLQRSSLFSGKTTPGEIIDAQVSRLALAGKKILVVDDNSNTGESAQLMFEALQKVHTQDARIRVAEFDMHRSMFKHLNWRKKPNHIAHPDLFLCSVGVTPITQGLDEFLAFRQQRKVVRLDILQDYFKTKEQVAPRVKLQPNRKATPRLKICGIHNVNDFTTCWNEGVQWFGVHCVYDDEKYSQKVKAYPRAHQLEYKQNLDFKVGESTGLPLAEIASLRAMFEMIKENDIRPRIVFLIDGHNKETLPALFKHVIPHDFNRPLYFQLQNAYSQHVVNDVYMQATNYYRHGVGLIQTFGSGEDDSLLQAANKNPLIDYILIDYQQKGGTGKTIGPDRLRAIVEKTEKQFFVAGGLNPTNVGGLVEILGDLSTNFSIDLESGVEHTSKEARFTVGYANECMIVRKSPKHVSDMVREWGTTQSLLEKASEYEALELDGSLFKESLNDSWLQSRDQYNFFAVKPTLEDHAKKVYLPTAPVSIRHTVDGLLKYENLPSYYTRHKYLSQIYTRNSQVPWIIESTPRFLQNIRLYIEKNNMHFYVWTAGEDPVADTEEYAHTNEQRLKFIGSGLARYMSSIGLDEGVNYTFLASPNKLPVLEGALREIDRAKPVVVLDDKISNLDAAEKSIKAMGFTHVRTFLVNSKKGDDSRLVKTVERALPYLKNLQDAIVFCDMDGVLIHEEFRNEHQPKNLYLKMHSALSSNAIYDLYGQRQSPLKINYSKLQENVGGYDKCIFILAAADMTSLSINNLLSQGNCRDVEIIPRITAEDRSTFPSDGVDQYINDRHFRELIRNEELIEYSYGTNGYKGTMYKMLTKSMKCNVNSVILLDPSTAHLMSRVLQHIGIRSRTVYIQNEKEAKGRNRGEETGTFDYVIPNRTKVIRDTFKKIFEDDKE